MTAEFPYSEYENRPTSFTLENVSRIASEVTLECGEHVPMLIVQGSERPLIGQLPDMPRTHEERLSLMLAVGVSIGADSEIGELEQVFFISEGWISTPNKHWADLISPSADPNRKEVIFISTLKIDGNHADVAIFEMIRQDKRLVALNRYETVYDPQKHTVASPLLNAFVTGFRRGASVRRRGD